MNQEENRQNRVSFRDNMRFTVAILTSVEDPDSSADYFAFRKLVIQNPKQFACRSGSFLEFSIFHVVRQNGQLFRVAATFNWQDRHIVLQLVSRAQHGGRSIRITSFWSSEGDAACHISARRCCCGVACRCTRSLLRSPGPGHALPELTRFEKRFGVTAYF